MKALLSILAMMMSFSVLADQCNQSVGQRLQTAPVIQMNSGNFVSYQCSQGCQAASLVNFC